MGLSMDNTSSNRLAFTLLHADMPHLLLVGCQSHALSLLIKDLGSVRHFKFGARVYEQARLLSNTINGSERVRALLHECQTQAYSGLRAVCSHCPTRFGTHHFICQDLVRSEQAIKNMVMDPAWDDASAGCSDAVFFHAIVVGARRGEEFFKDAPYMLRLVQPITDAIHQLESDSPLLSQVLPVWSALKRHAANWESDPGVPQGAKRVAHIFEARAAKHYSPCFAAAYVVDPIFFVRNEETAAWYPPVQRLTGEQVNGALQVFVDICGDAVKVEFARYELEPWPAEFDRFCASLTERQKDASGNTVIATPAARRGFWSQYAAKLYPLLARAAARLLSMHSTSCSAERNWSGWGALYQKARNRLALERASKLMYIRGNCKGSKSVEASDSHEIMLQLLAEPAPKAAAPARASGSKSGPSAGTASASGASCTNTGASTGTDAADAAPTQAQARRAAVNANKTPVGVALTATVDAQSAAEAQRAQATARARARARAQAHARRPASPFVRMQRAGAGPPASAGGASGAAAASGSVVAGAGAVDGNLTTEADGSTVHRNAALAAGRVTRARGERGDEVLADGLPNNHRT